MCSDSKSINTSEPTSKGPTARSLWITPSDLGVWLTALVLVGWALIGMEFQPGDPDARFYIFLTEQLSERSWPEILSPQWAGHQNLPHDAYIRDHYAGWPLLGVLLSYAGVPAAYSLMIVHLCIQVLTMQLLAFCLTDVMSRGRAWNFLLVAQLLPIAFLYRIHATHEPWVLFGHVLIFWLVRRSVARPGVSAGLTLVWLALVFCGVFLVKGIVAVMLIPTCMIALLLYHSIHDRTPHLRMLRLARFWLFPTGMILSFIVTVWSYDHLYALSTGFPSFFSEYMHIQFFQRAMRPDANLPMGLSQLKNLIFYLACLFWYTMPLSLLAIYHWVFSRRHARSLSLHSFAHRMKTAAGRWLTCPPERTRSTFMLLFALACGIWIVAFSLSSRLAVRYVYCAYFFAGAGLYAFLETLPRRPHLLGCRRYLSVSPSYRQKAAALFWAVLNLAYIKFA